jgi:uncharacterized protein (TIGR00106 family)
MIVAFSVAPEGDGSGGSLAGAVAEAVRVVRASGLPCETNAMFTNIEGEWDEVMAVVREAVFAVKAHSPRVSVVIKVDWRDGVTDALHGKVDAIERRLAD